MYLVENMQLMFYNCVKFNQPIHSWNVSNVRDMGYMFYKCAIFNQPLNSLDVSQVTIMSKMFSHVLNLTNP